MVSQWLKSNLSSAISTTMYNVLCYIDNQYVTEKPLKSYSPKKYAGNLSASSRSSKSSHDENGKVKLREHFRNVIIQEEQDDTESLKNSKRETNTESQSRSNLNQFSLYGINMSLFDMI